MDQQNIIFFGGLAFAVAVSAYILWGPSPVLRKKKGHIVGLVNLGSTCFLNTLLQALASCAIFVEWLDHQKDEEGTLTSALHGILWVLNGQGTGEVHSPIELLTCLKKHGWMVPAGEQDAHELFHVIMTTLQEENKRKSNAGSISDALPASDTLSQTSDILDDSPEHTNMALNEDVFGIDDVSEAVCVQVGEGDSALKSHKSSSTTAYYTDALERMQICSSESQSTTIADQFYSLEQDCGDMSEKQPRLSLDGDELTLKVETPERLCASRFRASQESVRGKYGVMGYYDRVTGCSPHTAQSEPLPFQGLLTSTLQCSVCCHHSSVQYNTFDSLSLPLGENFLSQIQTLQDLLRKFVKTEIIPEVDCSKCCRKTTAYKTMNFGKLPPCLCFHISRTTWQSYSHTPTKRDDYVDFPEFLPMDEYTAAMKLAGATSAKSLANADSLYFKAKHKHVYRLKSVVVHVGGVNSGHFVTYRRGALNTTRRHRVGKLVGACMDSQRWYLTSDENVRLSSLCKATDSLAYILFYEKCSTELLSLAGSMQEHLNL